MPLVTYGPRYMPRVSPPPLHLQRLRGNHLEPTDVLQLFPPGLHHRPTSLDRRITPAPPGPRKARKNPSRYTELQEPCPRPGTAHPEFERSWGGLQLSQTSLPSGRQARKSSLEMLHLRTVQPPRPGGHPFSSSLSDEVWSVAPSTGRSSRGMTVGSLPGVVGGGEAFRGEKVALTL